MLCAVCREREAVYDSLRVPGDTPPEERARCFHCWEREEARVDEQRLRDMPVDWDQVRPLLSIAEARGSAYELRKLGDLLQHAVERYGRVLPPDIADFLERHGRSGHARRLLNLPSNRRLDFA